MTKRFHITLGIDTFTEDADSSAVVKITAKLEDVTDAEAPMHRALVSENLCGDFNKDTNAARNFRQGLLDILLERLEPCLLPAYKIVPGSHGDAAIFDQEENQRRKTAWPEKFRLLLERKA